MVKNIKLFIVGLIFLLAGIAIITWYAVVTNQECATICDKRTNINPDGFCCYPNSLYYNCASKSECCGNGCTVLLVIGIIGGVLGLIWTVISITGVPSGGKPAYKIDYIPDS